ncbi:hypothetical protein D9M71_282820 [compost metagenome]
MLEGLAQRPRQVLDLRIAVVRRGVDAKTLGAHRYRGVVDRLQVHAVGMQQTLGRRLAALGLAHQYRQHVGLRAGHHRHVIVLEPLAQLGGLGMQAIALEAAGLEVLDAGQAAGGDRRRQRGGEDETHSEGAHGIDDHLGRGDIAADHADGLGHGALDDVHLIGHAQFGGDTGAARAVHAYGMHLVEVGEGVVALGDRDDFDDRGDVAVHRVDRLEHHDLRLVLWVAGEDLLEVRDIVVAKDPAFVGRRADAVDDGGMVQLIADHHAVGDAPQQALDGGVVGTEAGGKHQRCFLAVPVG